MRGRIIYDKQMRDKAKREGKNLVTIDVNGKAHKKGRMTFQFIADQAMTDIAGRAIREIIEYNRHQKLLRSAKTVQREHRNGQGTR